MFRGAIRWESSYSSAPEVISPTRRDHERWVKAYENQPARLIFSRSRSAFVRVAFITGRVMGSRRTSRIERMSRWTRSQGCCQAVRNVAIARGQ